MYTYYTHTHTHIYLHIHIYMLCIHTTHILIHTHISTYTYIQQDDGQVVTSELASLSSSSGDLSADSGEEVITSMRVLDCRWPTSDHADGSDAVHKDPDYSCVFVIIKTNKGNEGQGMYACVCICMYVCSMYT